jgi:hypothetical protein
LVFQQQLPVFQRRRRLFQRKASCGSEGGGKNYDPRRLKIGAVAGKPSPLAKKSERALKKPERALKNRALSLRNRRD